MGGETPIPIVGNDGFADINYKSHAIIMDFTPNLLAGNKIHVSFNAEVSNTNANANYQSGETILPGFDVRRVSSTTELVSGQSFAIGGLFYKQSEIGRNNVPRLNGIPFLSSLFENKNESQQARELLVIVTPEVFDLSKESYQNTLLCSHPLLQPRNHIKVQIEGPV